VPDDSLRPRVILVGLPELRERLALRHNRSLHLRLHQRDAGDRSR